MNAIEFAAEATNTDVSDWEYMTGPESGVGVEYWLFNDTAELEAYVAFEEGECVACEITSVE